MALTRDNILVVDLLSSSSFALLLVLIFISIGAGGRGGGAALCTRALKALPVPLLAFINISSGSLSESYFSSAIIFGFLTALFFTSLYLAQFWLYPNSPSFILWITLLIL